MSGPSSALETANAELLELATRRLGQLRNLGADALRQPFQKALATWNLRDASA